jgi:hypothetical protein
MRSVWISFVASLAICCLASAQTPMSLDDAILQEREHFATLTQAQPQPQTQPCTEIAPLGCIPSPIPSSVGVVGTERADLNAQANQMLIARYESMVKLVSLLEQKASLLEASMAYAPGTLQHYYLLLQINNKQELRIRELERQLNELKAKPVTGVKNAR